MKVDELGRGFEADVVEEVRGGSVVSMHFGYADTVAALPAVLEELHRRGLREVTVTTSTGNRYRL